MRLLENSDMVLTDTPKVTDTAAMLDRTQVILLLFFAVTIVFWYFVTVGYR